MTRLVGYPSVIGETDTIEKIHEGLSIGRIGDGETALMDGRSQVREPAQPKLAEELRRVVYDPLPGLIVGIPVLDPRGRKHGNWVARAPRILKFLNPKVQYYSAFISRPDSAAEDLCTPTYCNRVVDLWRGRRAVLVSEKDVSVYRLLQYTIGTGEILWIECPHRQTYAVIDQIEAKVVKAQPEIAMLSCGPAATCLSARLTKKGLHAVDIGSAGSFILKTLYNVDHPMSGKTHDGKQ